MEIIVNDTNIYDFYESIKTQSNLSWADCSVLLYTKNIRNAKLLTGDRKLRSHALQEKIDVSGILYVFDELLRNRIIDFKTAAEKLKTLINKNIRLPLEEVESRLKDWTSL